MVEVKKKTFLNKYASFSVVIISLLAPYFFPYTETPLSNFFLLFNGLLFFILGVKKKFSIPSFYKLFIIYALIVSPLVGLVYFNDIASLISSYKGIVLFSLCLIYSIPFLNYSLIKEYYQKIVVIASVIFVIQELMYASIGFRFSALIPFLPVSYAQTTMTDFIHRQMYLDRSSSFFLEPAHFAQFLLGYLAIILGENINESKILTKSAILVSLILLFTWSGNAIVLMLLLWLFFFIKIKTPKINKSFLIIPLLIVLFFSYDIISSTEKGSKLISRTEELSINQDRVSSGTMRIYRGYYVFSDMLPFQKITGVGDGNIANVINKSSFVRMFFDFERYVNNIQAILIGYGLIGLFIFFVFIIQLYNTKNNVVQLLIILFGGLCFLESFWCTGKMLLYLSIPMLMYNEKYCSKNIKDNYINK